MYGDDVERTKEAIHSWSHHQTYKKQSYYAPQDIPVAVASLVSERQFEDLTIGTKKMSCATRVGHLILTT